MQGDGTKETRPDRIKEGEFREWYFPTDEILEWVKVFFTHVGYKVLTPSYVGFTCPDFHVKRQTEKHTYEVVGVVRPHFDQALDGLTQLLSMKAVLGDQVDYVLVLPPVSEYLMLEFFRSEEGRWFWEIKDHMFMLWMANPDEEFVWCLVGGPRDRRFEEYFAAGKLALDSLLAMQLSRWESEEDY